MTDAERIEEIAATMDDGDVWIAKHVPWLLSVIAERDAEIAKLVHMLGGRTMSCELCNGNTARIAKLEAALRMIADPNRDRYEETCDCCGVAREALK